MFTPAETWAGTAAIFFAEHKTTLCAERDTNNGKEDKRTDVFHNQSGKITKKAAGKQGLGH